MLTCLPLYKAVAEDTVLQLRDPVTQAYAAPEITGITGWINGKPQTLAALRGKVVLLDFWTYSCINCLRTLPHLREWQTRYADKGFTIIGIHSPEFAFEKDQPNVQRAIDRFQISWPVGLDNNMATWRAYNNKYWPAKYLIDQQGRVVYTHFGEGAYDITEQNIRTLLGLGAALDDTGAVAKVTSQAQTPETYLGTHRAKSEWKGPDGTWSKIPLHQWQALGQWTRTPEYIESTASGDTLYLHFHAKKVFLVMEGSGASTVQVKLESGGGWDDLGKDAGDGRIVTDESRLYELADLPDTRDGVLKIVSTNPGTRLYAFTFESAPQGEAAK